MRQHIDAKHEGVGHYCDVCDYSAALATSVRIHKLRVYNVLVLQTWESCIYSSKEPGLYKVADKVHHVAGVFAHKVPAHKQIDYLGTAGAQKLVIIKKHTFTCLSFR